MRESENIYKNLDYLQDNLNDIQIDLKNLCEKIEGFGSEEWNSLPKRSLADEMKADFILENWDNLNLDDLEKLV